MEEEFVTRDIAKIMDDLQYNGTCFGFYSEDGDLIFGKYKNSNMLKGFTAPLWQQAIDWLRTKKVKVIESTLGGWRSYSSEKIGWDIYIPSQRTPIYKSMPLEEAILKALTLIS